VTPAGVGIGHHPATMTWPRRGSIQSPRRIAKLQRPGCPQQAAVFEVAAAG
jgi:hypothetical protein